jgi:hypothetical protein
MAKILPPEQAEGFQIVLKVAPADIDFLTRVVEGMDSMGMVSTVDPSLGLVVIWVTPDTRDEVLAVLASFPRPVEVLRR